MATIQPARVAYTNGVLRIRTKVRLSQSENPSGRALVARSTEPVPGLTDNKPLMPTATDVTAPGLR